MKVEGEPGPRFRAFALDRDGNPDERVFTCNELSELEGFKPRADRRYKWQVDGRWMTTSEFEAWKARQQ